MWLQLLFFSRHDIRDRDTKIHKLSNELRMQNAECERLQKIVDQHRRTQEKLQHEVEYRMFTLKVCIYFHHLFLGIYIHLKFNLSLSTEHHSFIDWGKC